MLDKRPSLESKLPLHFTKELLSQSTFQLRRAIKHLGTIGICMFLLRMILQHFLGFHWKVQQLIVPLMPPAVWAVISFIDINSISRFNLINNGIKMVATCSLLGVMCKVSQKQAMFYAISFFKVLFIFDQIQLFPNKFQPLLTFMQFLFVVMTTADGTEPFQLNMLFIVFAGMACEHYSLLNYKELNAYLINKLIQIQKLEAKWITLLKYLKVGIATFTGTDMSLTFCNDALLQIFEMNRGSLMDITTNFGNLVTVKKEGQQKNELSFANFLSEILPKVLSKELEVNTSFILKMKASKRVVDISFQLCEEEENLILMMVNEITTVKNLEKSKQIQKMKTIYFCSVAHDLKTPINSILASNQYLTQKFANNQGILQLTNVTKTSCQLLLRIIQDITDLSKIELKQFDLDLQWFDLEDVLSEVQDLMQLPFDMKKLKLIIQPLEYQLRDKCKVYSDAKRIKQILLNLIGNALKFTFSGEVVVSAEIGDAIQEEDNSEENFEIEDENEETKLIVFKVKDTGIGIREENMDQLFKLFGKVREQNEINKQGIGLGLTICKRLTELLGGTIQVKSEYGKGTEFTFTVKCEIEQQLSNSLRMSQAILSDDNIGSFRLQCEEYVNSFIFPQLQWEEDHR